MILDKLENAGFYKELLPNLDNALKKLEELGLALDKDAVQTHCEIAFKDRYGPGSGDPETKWDLWFLPDDARHGRLFPGGFLIRGKAAYYLWDMNETKKAA